MVIDELRKIQEEAGGWLPAASLQTLSKDIGVPLYELEGVASFYPEFRLAPPPDAAIKVCLDISCHLRGSYQLLQSLQEEARQAGRKLAVTGCSCLGQCDRAPAISVNDHIVIGPDVKRVREVAARAMKGDEPQIAEPPSLAVNKLTDPYSNPNEHYGALKKLVETKDFEGVIKQMADAGLKGMGGAGFDTYRKWTEIRKAKKEAVVGTSALGGLVNPDAKREVSKYIVCNADESEVGTFKDREILLSQPHLVVEAMVIAALVVGADKGYIYIRHEYHGQAEACRKEIERARKLGVLGRSVLGQERAFDLEVFVSPGGYVLGEQSALLEALEGKRGQPRNRRTDVGAEGSASISGLFNGPTLINNVETFAYVPLILLKSGAAFAKMGRNDKKGLKWFSISGDVNRPGVYEVPLGMTYRELLELVGGIRGGRQCKAFCPSGPTYGIHHPSKLDTPSDFGRFDEDLPRAGSGAVVYFDDSRCLVDVALNLTQFYRNESCGKCVPCRVGSAKMCELIKDCSGGRKLEGEETLAQVIDRLAVTLNVTSICGLGQVVHMPMQSVIKYWPEEVAAHFAGQCPAGVCGRQERRS
jgi:NADH:ubiquinone oxidoreductase subunit F (NADH-binding)/NADH:ubiquinone oxidoreductase subunit E